NQSRDRITFGWTGISDIDLSGYEIRFGTSWATGKVLATQIKTTSFISLNINLGTQNFWIKAIDTSGNYSATETQAVVSVTSVPFTNIIQSYSEETAFGGTKTNLVVSGNILVHATGQLSGT